MSTQHKTHNISIGIDATPEAAWKIIGAVGGVDKWFDPIKTCRVDGDKRYCTTEAGAFEENILKVDHENMEFHYAIPEQNMIPVGNIVGMMKVRRGGDGKAVVDWQWSFDVEEGDEEQALQMLSGSGTMGIRGIERLIKQEKTMNDNAQAYFTLLIWYPDGKTDRDFLEYQRKIRPVMERYGMKLLHVITPSAVMGKDVPFAKPDRIEVAAAADPSAMGKMQQDPEMTQYQELRSAAVRNVIVFPGKPAVEE